MSSLFTWKKIAPGNGGGLKFTKMYEKKNKNFAYDHSIYRNYVIFNESECNKTLDEGHS